MARLLTNVSEAASSYPGPAARPETLAKSELNSLSMADSLENELMYLIRKIEDEIADLKRFGTYDEVVARDLERRRDEHYKRLCEIDGITPEST